MIVGVQSRAAWGPVHPPPRRSRSPAVARPAPRQRARASPPDVIRRRSRRPGRPGRRRAGCRRSARTPPGGSGGRARGWRRCCRRCRWRPRSAGPVAARCRADDQPVGVVQARSGRRAGRARALDHQRRPRSRSRRCRRCRPDRGWRTPPGARRRPAPGRGRGPGEDEPTNSGVGAVPAPTHSPAGDDRTAQVRQRRQQLGEPAGIAPSADCHRASQSSPAGSSATASTTTLRVRPRVDPLRAAGHHHQLDVVATEQSRHRPGQRRMPEQHHPLDLLGQRRRRSSSRPVADASGPARALLPGSASSGRPACSARDRGDLALRDPAAASPATTTVCGPAGRSTGIGRVGARRDPQLGLGRRRLHTRRYQRLAEGRG